jgi:hypothetical protein
MKHNKLAFSLLGLIAALVFMGAADTAFAQTQRQGFSKDDVEKAKAEDKNNSQGRGATEGIQAQFRCAGKITEVIDVAYEGVKFTSANYFASPGGGEGGGFAKTPVLTTRVRLEKEVCLDAHLSAIVGSRVTYGVAALTLFQVTLTPVNGGAPQHMVGHYERPYGSSNGPAVALEAERDVDMYASNFFQRVGEGKHEVPAGDYRVDVWWSGNGPGGAIGAAFVLKLYLRG